MLKWIGTVVFLTFLSVIVVPLRRSDVSVDVGCGSVLLFPRMSAAMWKDPPNDFQYPRLKVGAVRQSWSEVSEDLQRLFILPSHTRLNHGVHVAMIPHWLPLAVIGLPTIWLWYLDRRRPAPGKCRCGYDLTGNTSGVCPECGRAMENSR